MPSHVRINDEIWEINTEGQKALKRVLENLSETEQSVINDSPAGSVESFIKSSMGFKHAKRIRPTKVIFSKFPICNYNRPSPRRENPDATDVCENLGEFNEGRGYRCSTHRYS